MREITTNLIKKYNEEFILDKANVIAMNAAINNGINNSVKNYEEIKKIQHNYSISIKTGDITDQKQSGRCWMFASLNLMRIEVMNNLNLTTMELSQNYPLFFDKLERSNYLIECIIKTINEPLDGRLVSHILTDPLGDGGQWDMFVNLVNKYGVVPKDAMPETISSSSTVELDKYLTLKLRKFACFLREEYKKGKTIEELYEMKDEMISTIYRMLCIALGKPPTCFTYEVTDKNDKFIRIENITPINFYKKYVGLDLNNYISIINAPTMDKPFERVFTIQYLGNVVGGNDIKYLNLEIERLKELAIAQMKDGKTVMFGSDVSQCIEKKQGILSAKIFDIDKLFNTSFTMTKKERLDYKESTMNHAMLFTGVNLDNGDNANRWRVENSWGKDVGKDGFYVMTDEWFDEFVYQVIINKKYLNSEEINMLNKEPIVLKPWDPIGSLALK